MSDTIENIRDILHGHVNRVDAEVRKLVIEIGKLKDTVHTLLSASGIYLYDGRVNKEDKYLMDILNILCRRHDFVYDLAVLHYRYDNHEFDLVVIGESAKGKRVALVEFKESNILKLVEQGISRKEYCDYIYVAYSGPLHEELSYHPEIMRDLAHHGVGMIYLHPCPVTILKARTQVYAGGRRLRKAKMKEKLCKSVEEWADNVIRKSQHRILDYLTNPVRVESGGG